jgi:hypothetical protein
MATKDVPPRKPRRYLWPEEAVNIAQKKQHPVRLCEELMALTGYDKAACWRFVSEVVRRSPVSIAAYSASTLQ